MNTEKDQFTAAYKRLKEIYQEISSQEIVDIDHLLALQKEAKSLYEYLQQRLEDLPKSDA